MGDMDVDADETKTKTDADAKPKTDKTVFPLMLLPPEIRNEIYRACLVRPFDILLSRKGPPAPQPRPKGEIEIIPHSSDDDDTLQPRILP